MGKWYNLAVFSGVIQNPHGAEVLRQAGCENFLTTVFSSPSGIKRAPGDLNCTPFVGQYMEIPELLLLVLETSLVSLCMKIMSVLITVILYGRMIEIYLYCSVSPIPFATMTNREWGQIGNNYLKGLFALGFQGFLIMICVGIYAVLVNDMIIADNLHSAVFSLAAYTVILCFSLFKSGTLAKSIFNAH